MLDLLYNLHLFYPVILTNNSSGGVDDGPRGVCRALSTRGEEQLDGERLSERLLIQLHAGLVAAVPSTYGHLLPFHQLHQLLRLAGWTQVAWLVPVNKWFAWKPSSWILQDNFKRLKEKKRRLPEDEDADGH